MIRHGTERWATPERKEKERWRPIPGYGSERVRYEASNKGNIRRVLLRTGETKPKSIYYNSGAWRVKLARDGRNDNVSAARAVALAWLGDVPPDKLVVTRNGIHSDLRPENLIYMSRSECGKYQRRNRHRKPVVKMRRNGEVVEVYPSVIACAKANGYAQGTISNRCRRDGSGMDEYLYQYDECGKGRASLTEVREKPAQKRGRKPQK